MLGDFNIGKRQGNPLFDAFVETGLWVPEALQSVKTTAGKTAKHYDPIAWFHRPQRRADGEGAGDGY